MQKKTDIFEELADRCFAEYYGWEIDDMLKYQPAIEVAKFIAGPVEVYDNTLQAKIVELIVYNRIKSEHSGAIVRF